MYICFFVGFIRNIYFNVLNSKIVIIQMALLKEDNLFTHVIAIDFGTGCSGYLFDLMVDLLLLQD